MNFNKNLIQSSLLLGMGTLSVSAFALEPSTFKLGEYDFIPTADVKYLIDDNIFLSDQNLLESNILLISPRAQLVMEKETTGYFLETALDSRTYSESPDDDFVDWHVKGEFNAMIDPMHAIDISAGFFSTHEIRGTGFSEGNNLPSKPNEYDDFNVDFHFLIGTDNSFARADLDFLHFNRSHTNNRLITLTRDRDSQTLGSTVYFQALSLMDILLEVRYASINYLKDPIFNPLDNSEFHFFIGSEWDDLFNTYGSLKLGTGKKKFDSSARTEVEAFLWQGEIHWQFFSGSIISFYTSREFSETKGSGSSQENTTYELDWQYHLLENLSTNIRAGYYDDMFNDSDRADDTYSITLQVNYKLARWLDTSLSFKTRQRDSSFSNYQFDSNVITFGFEASL